MAATGKRAFAVTVGSVRVDPAPEPAVVVVQALPKGDRGELAVEVLTEVGVGEIVPWAASRSVAVWKGERGDKVAGALAVHRPRGGQAGAARLVPRGRAAGLHRRGGRSWSRAADLAVVLHEEATALARRARGAGRRSPGGRGRPRGRADRRGGRRRSPGPGADAVRLGAEVLRTSTAGVAAVAALLARTPRWR